MNGRFPVWSRGRIQHHPNTGENRFIRGMDRFRFCVIFAPFLRRLCTAAERRSPVQIYMRTCVLQLGDYHLPHQPHLPHLPQLSNLSSDPDTVKIARYAYPELRGWIHSVQLLSVHDSLHESAPQSIPTWILVLNSLSLIHDPVLPPRGR